MSRIFDALRRSGQANIAGFGSAPTRENRRQALLTSQDSPPVAFDRVKSVVCHPLPEEHILGVGEDSTAQREIFRVLSCRLQKLRQQQKLSHILVTSAIVNEGKTTVALNLVATLARSSPRVLLVDADVRQRRAHRALGLGSLLGLADFLEGRIDAVAAYRRVDPLGFYYLPAGRPSANAAELLQKRELHELIKGTTAAFDWIIIDSPPLTPYADARHLAPLVDAVLLVVREGRTPREAAKQALTALEGAFVAGVVLNGSTDSQHDYNRYYLPED